MPPVGRMSRLQNHYNQIRVAILSFRIDDTFSGAGIVLQSEMAAVLPGRHAGITRNSVQWVLVATSIHLLALTGPPGLCAFKSP